jgi:membrane associated rhomboid family serine protease
MQFDTGGMFARPPPGVLFLMVATGALSILAMASVRAVPALGPIIAALRFSPVSVLSSWQVWTPFTYPFLLPDPLYLLFYEVFGLWVFGSQLERQWGTRRFLIYFFGTVTGAAVVTTFLALFISPLLPFFYSGSLVASEAILVGWVLTNWHSSAYFFIFPVRAPVLLLLSVVLNVLYMFYAWEPFVPVFLAMGIGYLMLSRRANARRAWLHVRAWWIDRQLKSRAKHLKVVPPPERDFDDRKGSDKYLH